MKPYYSQDGITIYHGDWKDVLPTLPKADLILTSPPYNLGNTTGGGFPSLGHYDESNGVAKRGGGGKWAAASRSGGLAFGYGQHGDSMPHDEYVAWQKEFLSLAWKTLADNGAIYYNHKPRVLGGRVVLPIEYIPGDLMSQLRQVVIWSRSGGVNFSPAFYVPTHEWIAIIAKREWRLKSKGASGVGDVWQIPQETGTKHPAPFPLRLARRAIETSGAGLVIDPHAGSGTTLFAAKLEGKRAIGIEINPEYCEEIKNRLRQKVLFK